MRSFTSVQNQHTVRDHIEICGTGLHSGAETILRIHPAKEDHGIIFVRSDVSDRNNRIPALWNSVVDTQLCTVIGNEDGVTVGTIEHLMAALHALNIDNAMIELDGPEVPILDGSSAVFVDALLKTGIKAQEASRKIIKILEPIQYEEDGKTVTLLPADDSSYKMDIDFDHQSIGKQSYTCALDAKIFAADIAKARTFGFVHEVNHLRSLGLCLGGSLENAIVLDEEKVLNPEGLHHEDEFARHKVLDAIGDLYLAGHSILGAYKGYKAGHALNNKVLHVLFSAPEKWAYVHAEEVQQDAPITAMAAE